MEYTHIIISIESIYKYKFIQQQICFYPMLNFLSSLVHCNITISSGSALICPHSIVRSFMSLRAIWRATMVSWDICISKPSSTMLNFAERPEVLFRAPLKIMKLAPVTELIDTYLLHLRNNWRDTSIRLVGKWNHALWFLNYFKIRFQMLVINVNNITIINISKIFHLKYIKIYCLLCFGILHIKKN